MTTVTPGTAPTVSDAPNLVPNGDFRSGLDGWAPPDGTHALRVVGPGPDDETSAVELDGRSIVYGTVTVSSDSFAVTPLGCYELGWKVRLVRGSGYRYTVTLIFLDAHRHALDENHSTVAFAVGPEWLRRSRRVVVPEEARFAKVVLGMEMGHGEKNVMRFTGVSLTEAAPLGEARLEVNLAPGQPSPGGMTADLVVVVENRADRPAGDVSVAVELPPGMASDGALSFRTKRLSFHQKTVRSFRIGGRPADPGGRIRCTVSADMGGERRVFIRETPPFITTVQERITPTSRLEAPQHQATSVNLGCYYFPSTMVWTQSPTRDAPECAHLKPRLGYYDEARPEVADWHIHWAVSHGISFFAFDWYWNQGHEFINQALDEGFLKSRFAADMKFCIHWCNADASNTEYHPLDSSTETMVELVQTLCKRYFHRSNYLRVDGKPVFILLMPGRIANANGGWEGCARVVAQMRESAQAAGMPGIYLVAQQDDPYIEDFAKGGFDAVTTYTYGYNQRHRPFAWQLSYHRECFRTAQQLAHAQKLDYIPVGWSGWDNVRWAGSHATRTEGNTPVAFRRMVEMLPEYAEPTHRLALVEAWNEWGEGSVIEPGVRYGFGYLCAIRDALAPGACGPRVVPVPDSDEVDRLRATYGPDYLADLYHRPYALRLELEHGFNMEFESNRSLWFHPDSRGDSRDVRIEHGCLRARSVGPNPLLAGPPVMNLDSALVSAVQMRMAVSAGVRATLFWITDAQRNLSSDRSVSIDLRADGQMHEYTFALAGRPQWEGRIREFALRPTDEPGDVAVDYIRTMP